MNNILLRSCRICLEHDGELILPCVCVDGYVHRSCLDTWRDTKLHPEICEICNHRYNILKINNLSRIIRFAIFFYICLQFIYYCAGVTITELFFNDLFLNFTPINLFKVYLIGVISTQICYFILRFIMLIHDAKEMPYFFNATFLIIRIFDLFIPFLYIILTKE